MASIQVAGPSNIIRSPPEIIDVDALPDDNGLVANLARRPYPQSRPQSRSHSQARASSSRTTRVIYVLDSDDEERASPLSGAPRQRLVSPAAPTVQQQNIPPVPAIPRRFAHHRHRGSGSQTPPVIIPNNTPFPFETHIEHRVPTPPPPVLPPRGAPRSQHQPILGLGGALIAWNRREEEHRQNSHHTAAHSRRFRPLGVLADTLRHYFATGPEPLPGHVPYVDIGGIMEPDWGGQLWDAEWLPEHHRLPKRATKQPAWLPSYTHPAKPQPGFSFDFEPKVPPPQSPKVIVIDDDDDDVKIAGSSSASAPIELPPALVCARCLDPLVIAGQDSGNLSDEVARRIRVWSLRCGHMLDGKCIEEIMRPELLATEGGIGQRDDEGLDSPAEVVEPYSSGYDETSQGKGKARVEVALADSKGKGKAVDRAQDYDMAEDTSIRSRLRPRGARSLASVSITDVSMASTTSTVESSRPTRPLPRRGGGARAARTNTTTTKPKGKGKARKPVVEGRHEWFCPVSGCCREHNSVRMRGEEEWKMDENLGAIALFV